ncbi:hypothetical protein Bca52824_001581 [Brassica carinata]|uniref:Uncharacterized protein n=1 Tax=Brassica carinata TaxID=52824 RepID=A0A8X7WJ03_BRACI|nr:hypothetical protein Bca52824_001581 [Brassica carinata]
MYAPYETTKMKSWKVKNIREESSHSKKCHGGALKMDRHGEGLQRQENSRGDGMQIMLLDAEPSEKAGVSQNSGWSIASAIVTPSRIDIPKTDNVTLHDKGEPRALTFSPMEKERYKEDMESGQMIDTLQDMDIGESDGLVM